MNRIKLLLFGLLFFASSLVVALEVPALTARVNDNAGVISADYKGQLENILKDYEQKTGNQFFILTVDSIAGAGSIEQYGIAVADKWKVGQKKKDNGIILIVAVKERQVRIEVGYGLEGKLPDAMAGRIIRQVIVPEFKSGNYSAGIAKGTLAAIKVIGGYEGGDQDAVADDSDKKVPSRIRMIVLLIIVVFSIIFRIIFSFGSIGRRFRSGGGGSGIFFGGGGFGGGFGGGGFGGGGGGGFGGGGASGSW